MPPSHGGETLQRAIGDGRGIPVVGYLRHLSIARRAAPFDPTLPYEMWREFRDSVEAALVLCVDSVLLGRGSGDEFEINEDWFGSYGIGVQIRDPSLFTLSLVGALLSYLKRLPFSAYIVLCADLSQSGLEVFVIITNRGAWFTFGDMWRSAHSVRSQRGLPGVSEWMEAVNGVVEPPNLLVRLRNWTVELWLSVVQCVCSSLRK